VKPTHACRAHCYKSWREHFPWQPGTPIIPSLAVPADHRFLLELTGEAGGRLGCAALSSVFGLAVRLPGPVGEFGAGGQGAGVLGAGDPLDDRQQRGELAIFEEIGDRAGIASTFRVLRTDQGRPADAISYQAQALAIHAELSSPHAAVDVRMLCQQRATLGDQQFQRILRTLMDDDQAVAVIMRVTDQAG